MVRIRRGVLDLTLGMLPPALAWDGERPGLGQLEAAAARHGLDTPSFAPPPEQPVDASKSFFVLDRDRCILCGRCVAACQEVQHIGAIALIGKGRESTVGAFGDSSLAESICTSCATWVSDLPS